MIGAVNVELSGEMLKISLVLSMYESRKTMTFKYDSLLINLIAINSVKILKYAY